MRIWADVPDKWVGLIKKARDIEGWNSISAYIRELIKNDLKQKGLLGVKNGEKEDVFEEV